MKGLSDYSNHTFAFRQVAMKVSFDRLDGDGKKINKSLGTSKSTHNQHLYCIISYHIDSHELSDILVVLHYHQ